MLAGLFFSIVWLLTVVRCNERPVVEFPRLGVEEQLLIRGVPARVEQLLGSNGTEIRNELPVTASQHIEVNLDGVQVFYNRALTARKVPDHIRKQDVPDYVLVDFYLNNMTSADDPLREIILLSTSERMHETEGVPLTWSCDTWCVVEWYARYLFGKVGAVAMKALRKGYTSAFRLLGKPSDILTSFLNGVERRVIDASEKARCVGHEFWMDLVYHNQRRTFLVAMAPYTRVATCDATSSYGAIAYIMQQRIDSIENGNWSEWCHALNNGGVWHGSVRIALWEKEDATENVWEIPCYSD
ncbi:hypothetical protein Cantr_02289 [Candida viswanathii]|uniref:Uncharacterized protein n=1 Tax=Candida viswanathii TaxID=5486 RepID=A0A367YLI7_9ASCO|nr:hypothetical protein Cantr_02289 [Candida viswanathii]